jgi:hypothetical protein
VQRAAWPTITPERRTQAVETTVGLWAFLSFRVGRAL